MIRKLTPALALLLCACGVSPNTASLKAPTSITAQKAAATGDHKATKKGDKDADKGAAPGAKKDGNSPKVSGPRRQGIGSEIESLAHAYSVVEDASYGAGFYQGLSGGQRSLQYIEDAYRASPNDSPQEAACLIALGKLGPSAFDYLVQEYRGATVESRREAAALVAMGMAGAGSFTYLAQEYRGANNNSLRESAALVGLGLTGSGAFNYLAQEYRGASTDGEREAASLVGLGLTGSGAFSYLVQEYRGATTGGLREIASVVGLCLTDGAGSQDYARQVYNQTSDRRVRSAVDFGLDQARRM
ncbi:MAG: hypothetical protein JWM80_4682 [Cyanobacteria bacterium RYN_339]|nr:hypothetical protein [Cyanobacteria bacterium RYN_339]